MEITLSRLASGIRYFVLGFIKRIAVGAVLIDGYKKIFTYSWEAPNFMVIFLLLILVYFGVYFSLTGYYDMATGLSRMYGINAPAIEANPLKNATVNEYSHSLLGNVREWSERYVIRPIEQGRSKKLSRLAKISVICLCAVAFVRTELITLVSVIPLIAFSFASARA